MLPVAIESVIIQTFKDWELLIIDDGSTDNTKDIVFSYHDERIKYFYQENQERCAARNHGVEKSSGKYITFLDSDDYLLADRLLNVYNNLRDLSEPDLFMFTGVRFDKNGVLSIREEKKITEFPNKYDFFMHSHIHCQQTIIPRKILLQNKFNINFNIAEDTELWMRIITNYNFLFLEGLEDIVVTDHDDRSINVTKNNVYAKVLVVFSYMIKQFNYPFSKQTVKYINTDGNFGIAKYYIYNRKRFRAAKHIILSILHDLKHQQIKYRINILIKIIVNIKKAELLIK